LAQAPASHLIFVLEVPNTIVEYDVSTFAVVRTVPVPPRIAERPDYLRVNASGQMIFTGEAGMEFTTGDLATAATRVWAWDGREAHEFPREDDRDTAREWFLSPATDTLYALENRFAITRDQDGHEESQRASARLLRADLTGRRRQVVMGPPQLAPCTCETGTCSESCAQWDAWAPGGVIDRFLVLTKFIPGQLQTDYQQSTIYRRAGQPWRPATLPRALETPLDASPDGLTLLAAVPDAGCCGWINGSSNQLLVIRNGRTTILFDEVSRFGNEDYEVSFVAMTARLSPDGARAAYTVAADAPPPGEGIRLSDSGKDNPQELARIRQVMTMLPSVEVVGLVNPTKPVTITHAELVGWIDDGQLLVVQEGHLAVYSPSGDRLKRTAIAAKANAAWLR